MSIHAPRALSINTEKPPTRLGIQIDVTAYDAARFADARTYGLFDEPCVP